MHDIRDYAEGKHRVTDDYTYAGGGGMMLKPEPFFAAPRKDSHTTGLLDPREFEQAFSA